MSATVVAGGRPAVKKNSKKITDDWSAARKRAIRDALDAAWECAAFHADSMDELYPEDPADGDTSWKASAHCRAEKTRAGWLVAWIDRARGLAPPYGAAWDHRALSFAVREAVQLADMIWDYMVALGDCDDPNSRGGLPAGYNEINLALFRLRQAAAMTWEGGAG